MNDLKAQLEKLASSNSTKSNDADGSSLVTPLIYPGFFSSSSNNAEDDDNGGKKSSGMIKENDENLSLFFAQVKAIESSTHALNATLQTLKSRQERLSKKYTASVSNDMDLTMSDLVTQALRIKLSLETLDRENKENRKTGGNMYAKGSSVDRVRVFVTNKLRSDLRGSMEELAALQAMMRESQKSDLRRMLYIFKGEIVESDEALERMIDSGEGQELMRSAIREQGLGNSATDQAKKTEKPKGLGQKHTANDESYEDERLPAEEEEEEEKEKRHLKAEFVAEIEQRFGSMKKLEESLAALKQTFLQMGELVEVQGEELNDIEKNMVEARSFVELAAAEQGGAKQEAEKKQKTIATKLASLVTVLLLLLIATAAIVLLLLLR